MSRMSEMLADLMWEEFLMVVTGKGMLPGFADCGSHYHIKAKDALFELGCVVEKSKLYVWSCGGGIRLKA